MNSRQTSATRSTKRCDQSKPDEKKAIWHGESNDELSDARRQLWEQNSPAQRAFARATCSALPHAPEQGTCDPTTHRVNLDGLSWPMCPMWSRSIAEGAFGNW